MPCCLSAHAAGADAAGAGADNSFSTMSLIAFAASNPSVRSAGLLGSMPTKTMVGKPCICRTGLSLYTAHLQENMMLCKPVMLLTCSCELSSGF